MPQVRFAPGAVRDLQRLSEFLRPKNPVLPENLWAFDSGPTCGPELSGAPTDSWNRAFEEVQGLERRAVCVSGRARGMHAGCVTTEATPLPLADLIDEVLCTGTGAPAPFQLVVPSPVVATAR